MRSTMYLGALLVLFVATAGAQYDRKIGAAPAPAMPNPAMPDPAMPDPAMAGGMMKPPKQPGMAMDPGAHPGMAMGPGPHPGMAMGPGPHPGPHPKPCEDHNPQTDADLLFILSASQATFTNATTLQLSGASSTVVFQDSKKHGSTPGIVMTSMFTNSTPGSRYVSAAGQWLAAPDAALLGTTNGTNGTTAVLLALSSPMYDPATQMVSFTVRVVPANESDIKLHKGVVNGLAWDAKKGNGAPLVTAVQPGAMMSNVALFVDSNKAALQPPAATEDWRGGWGGGWNGGGWNGGGWNGGGWGGNNGWNRGWNGGWGGGGWGGWGSGISINVGR